MSPHIQVIRQPVIRAALRPFALYDDFVKAVVDCDRRIMAVGGELHADEEQVLLEDGSQQKDLWGINLYLDSSAADWLEYDSMINLRPSQHNRSRGVESEELRSLIRNIVRSLVTDA